MPTMLLLRRTCDAIVRAVAPDRSQAGATAQVERVDFDDIVVRAVGGRRTWRHDMPPCRRCSSRA